MPAVVAVAVAAAAAAAAAAAVVAAEDFVAVDHHVMQKLADMKPNYAALVPDTVPLLVVVAAAASLSGFGAVPMGRHAVRHFEGTLH
jgi:hypothetical protein